MVKPPAEVRVGTDMPAHARGATGVWGNVTGNPASALPPGYPSKLLFLLVPWEIEVDFPSELLGHSACPSQLAR